MRYAFVLSFLFIASSLSLLSCSSEPEGETTNDTGVGYCKTSEDCNRDEECVNNSCIKRIQGDAGYEVGLDVLGGDVGVEGYRYGIISVYEGSVYESEGEGYIVRGVVGYYGDLSRILCLNI